MNEELNKAFERQNIIDTLQKRISKFILESPEELPIKNVIIMVHNTLESIINLLLSRYYLGKEMEKTDKNKINHFWINVLVEINFEKKVRMLQETKIFNDDVIKAFYKINDIRNDVAHYPHRMYKRKNSHLIYDGKHIFKDVEALRMFSKDFNMIMNEARRCIE